MLRIIAVFAFATTIPVTIMATHYLSRHPADCDIVSIDKYLEVARRARVGERRIADACESAAALALLTLRELKARPEIGLVLATRDAASAPLCGGDIDSVERAAIDRDVAGAFSAVLALYKTWCPPNCHADGIEMPAEL